MYRKLKTLVAALFIAAVFSSSLVGGAVAAPLGQALPVTKTPASQRIDISGKVATPDTELTLAGTGGYSGSDFELDLTLTAPNSGAGISALELGYKLVDGVYYVKTGDLGQEKWYSIDTADPNSGLSGLGGLMLGGLGGLVPGVMGGLLPGGSGANPTAINSQLVAAMTVTSEGVATLNAVATTKYRIDVDVPKLNSILAQQLPGSTLSGTGYGQSAKMVVRMWIGDSDMYVYRSSLLLDRDIVSGDTTSHVTTDLTYDFYNFDHPITITAPANAAPSSLAGTLPTGTDLPEGGATADPAVGTTADTVSVLPRTGSNEVNPAVWFAALSLLLLGVGVVLRRRWLVAVEQV